MPPILYLVDGHALAYRTYFALTRGSGTGFTTSNGEPTAGVYGFTSVLLRILEQERPDYLAVAFDTGRTFRDDLYPDYKGTREKMPDELRSQIERARQLVDAFNIPRLEQEGYEADDVLGSVARQAADNGLGVKIITGDRDLLQLVDERIIVNLPGKSLSDAKDYLPEQVVEFLGVRPDQIVDYKALVGDKSDNIPGVLGIGEKTAVALLQKYGDLDSVYAHLEELSKGVQKKLYDGRDSAYLSRKLAKIVEDLEVTLDLEKARPERFNPSHVESIFRALEFRSLMPRLHKLMQAYGKVSTRGEQQLPMFESIDLRKGKVSALSDKQSGKANGREVILVNTPGLLRELANRLDSADVISFDTETTSKDQMRAELVGISISTQTGEGYYIPIGHKTGDGPQLPISNVLEAISPAMTNHRIPKIGHNLKYDFVVMARHGLRVYPLSFDTMIAEWLINPASRNLGLKNLAWVRQDIRMTDIDELIGKGKNQSTMAEVSIRKAADYAAADAEVVLRLMPQLNRELEERQASALFVDLEMPLVQVLADMEMEGISLDTNFLFHMSAELNDRMQEIEKRIYESVGSSFNLNSPQQLSEALFGRLSIPPPDRTRKTKSGYYSTSADVLESLRGQHPVVDLVLDYRELTKLKSTYLDSLPGQVNPQTDRIHTSYNQTGSVTGRIASSDPNLQNIPIRTELGRKVRNAFVASNGNLLLSVDYSQIELRIVAHMANDATMKAAFRSGQDIHATTAAAIFDVPLNKVDATMRRRAKEINFGLIYGMSAFGLTRYSDLTLAEAEDFMDSYFNRFPGVKDYLDHTRRLAADQGYVETLLGRRRYFPGLRTSTDRNTRWREEREAVNAPIQGTAADIMKLAMIRVSAALSKSGLSARMLLQVHDELVLECPTNELETTADLVMKEMENAYDLDVALTTEARYGLNWGEMKVVGG